MDEQVTAADLAGRGQVSRETDDRSQLLRKEPRVQPESVPVSLSPTEDESQSGTRSIRY